ncbi:MAG TPA: nitroreductase family deazaflavin-dependent oxidoreductase [Acidimicrobiales bacterium]|nr:nitroreductase family deazaflavin-dependent oxidoreductase [Acidimicrobiales bacterium]
MPRRRPIREDDVQPPYYRQPGWFTRHVFNGAVAGLTKLGVSLLGSRVLEVAGRKSGKPRRTPVNLLSLGVTSYLVAARGEAQWVRNVRAADGRVDLLLGRKRGSYVATELRDEDKVPVLRAYLKRWKFEVGTLFEGVGPGSSDEQIAAIAIKHPVFSLAERQSPDEAGSRGN